MPIAPFRPFALTGVLSMTGVVFVAAVSLTSGRPQGRPPQAYGTAALQGGRSDDFAVPFHVGEVLTYDISWSTYLTAGTATLSVKERRPLGRGAFAYDIIAEGRPAALLDKLYHLYYKAESLLDTRALQPSVFTVYSDERGRTKLRTMRFLSGTSMEYEPKASAAREKYTIPPLSQDPLSAIYVMRAVSLKPGQILTMPVVDGGDVYVAKWQIAGPETLTKGMGAISAWRLAPTLTDAKGKPITNRRITLWMSNDARRLPLKFQAGLPVGSFTFTLARVGGQQ